jgi:RNA polymerase sigma-70 factor (ECF subfamily)
MTAEREQSTMVKLILDGYIDGLFGYAMVLTRRRSEAEDLVQETCFRAIGAMAHLRPDSNIRSWLLTILRNLWMNQMRRRRTTPEVAVIGGAESVAVDSTPDPHALYVNKTERERVLEAIARLPARQREIILLREYEELSYQEIAAVLACPVGTVMSRLGRARTRLRRLLLVTEPFRQTTLYAVDHRVAISRHRNSPLNATRE